MRHAWLAIPVAMLCVPALAEDLPVFDVRYHCAVTSAAGRSVSAACQRAEEAARGAIGVRWAAYPKQRKHFCVQSVTFRRKDQRSYVSLAECLDDPATTS